MVFIWHSQKIVNLGFFYYKYYGLLIERKKKRVDWKEYKSSKAAKNAVSKSKLGIFD